MKKPDIVGRTFLRHVAYQTSYLVSSAKPI